MMFRLPVSGLEVTIRQPVGEDDLLLQEMRASNTALALTLISRLVRPADGSVVDWGELTITDLEALLLLIRKVVVGDLIEADLSCIQPECGAKITVSFSIREYLSYRQSRRPNEMIVEGEGWFRLQEPDVKFRLPAASDLMAVMENLKPDRELMRRCIQPERISTKLKRRVMNAMAMMAPNLSSEMQGECPECHHRVDVYFDVQEYVLRELRDRAKQVYEDVHLLAFNYRWSEESILLLPRNRRMLYAEMVRQERLS
jgi:hypothetical protein